MTGVKGRSGRTSSIAARQRRIEAALKGSRAAKAATHVNALPIVQDQAFAGPFLCIADYDRRLGAIQSWADVERREKAIAQILGNQALAIRNDVERGTLLTREQIEERDQEWNAAMAAAADNVQRLLDNVPGVTAEQREAFQAAFRSWRSDLGHTLGAMGEA